jgi:hypothetical protein
MYFTIDHQRFLSLDITSGILWASLHGERSYLTIDLKTPFLPYSIFLFFFLFLKTTAQE